jgi:membrane associated rhomboid family serine protease
MGYENREYMRPERRGFSFGGGGFVEHPGVRGILFLTCGVFLLQLMFGRQGFQLAMLWPLDSGFFYPWQPLSYGFLHDVRSLGHIVFNMFGLWFFGKLVEDGLGTREFVAFYLLGILAGAAGHLIQGALGPIGPALGASAAIMAITGWAAVKYPYMKVQLMLVIPLEMRWLAVLYIVMDTIGAGANIAHGAHLGGIAFGLAAAWFNWRFTGWSGLTGKARGWARGLSGARRGMKVYRPMEEPEDLPPLPPRPEPKPSDDFQERVDQILAKISRDGEAALSDEERRILVAAAEVYKARQRQ